MTTQWSGYYSVFIKKQKGEMNHHIREKKQISQGHAAAAGGGSDDIADI